MTAGLSSASFCWIASAVRYSASASAGLPVCDSTIAEVVVAVRQGLRKSVTAGLSSTSFCWIASALRYSASASAGLSVSMEQIAEVVVAVRQTIAEFGDGGVIVGQLLQDCQRLRYSTSASAGLPVVRQQDAEVVVVLFARRRLPIVCPSGRPRRGPPDRSRACSIARRASSVRPMVLRSQPAA